MDEPPPEHPDQPPERSETPPAAVGRQPGRARARLTSAVRHPEATAALLAILIGFASVLSAVIAWRASLASIDASRYESLAVQQQARQQQIERELAGLVAQDLRFVNVYQEHALAARELRAQADQLRAADPVAADALDLESQARQDLARNVLPFFMGASGVTLDDDGIVAYDTDYVLRNLLAGHTEHRELRPQHTSELAQRADTKALGLVGVAAVIVAALFLLTIAQVSHARARIRQVFFVAGAVLVLLGTVGFLAAEVLG